MSEGGKNNTENRHTHRWRAETRVNKGKNKLVYIWLSLFFGPTILTFRKAVQNWTLVNTMLSTSTFLFTSSKWGFLSHPGWVFFFKCRQGIPMGTRVLPIRVGSHFLRTCGILPFKWITSSATLAVSKVCPLARCRSTCRCLWPHRGHHFPSPHSQSLSFCPVHSPHLNGDEVHWRQHVF